jgi:(p)ppGpp synthase/HD superfamily hydrolase
MRALTRAAHAGQTRNAGRVPYWVHTDAVADICRSALARPDAAVGEAAEDLLLAAYGHDLYEDTSVSRDLIRREYGDRVDRWIADLTNQQGDTDREAYLRHLAGTEDEVRVVKCADLIDNQLSVAYGLHDLGLPWAREFLLPIATETRDVLRATPFARLPEIGRHMLLVVDWAWERLAGSMTSADGHGWAEAAGGGVPAGG